MKLKKQTVVTGMGLVSPIGIGSETFWEALLDGRSGISIREELADTEWGFKIGGLVDDFDGKQFVKPRKAMKVMCRPIQFGFAAAAMAAEQSKIVGNVDPDRFATVFGAEPFYADPNEIAGVFQKCMEDQQYNHDRWGESFMREIQPLWMLKYLPNMVASHISIHLDARGPSNSICQGDVSSALSLIEGATLIERGLADAVVVGGTGSPCSITGLLYKGEGILSKRIDDPANACRPFDHQRDGQVVGEGAGALVIETLESAQKRGAQILGRLRSFNRSFSPTMDRLPNEIETNITELLDQSGLSLADVGHLNASGFAEPETDTLEAFGLQNLLSELPVFAAKANFGNCGPASSVLEIAASILAANSGVIPPAINFSNSDIECPVRLKSAPQTLKSKSFLKLAFSKTGQVVSLLFDAAN